MRKRLGDVLIIAYVCGLAASLAAWLVFPVLFWLGHDDLAWLTVLAAFLIGALFGLLAPSVVMSYLDAPRSPSHRQERARARADERAKQSQERARLSQTRARAGAERARVWKARRATATYYLVLVLAVAAGLGCVAGFLVDIIAPSGLHPDLRVPAYGFAPGVIGASLPYLIAVRRFGSWDAPTGGSSTDNGSFGADGSDADSGGDGSSCGS